MNDGETQGKLPLRARLGGDGVDQIIFALDIGTRKVTGIVLDISGEKPKIIAACTREHESRAMIDGQIQDIGQVTRVVATVKAELEKKAKRPITHAAIAAAGRTLRTVQSEAQRPIALGAAVTRSDILALEMEAVAAAQATVVSDDQDEHRYYCVGYSVMQYQLDGDRIVNLLGQRGRTMGVYVLATFLPQVVVDSLLAVLEQTGLELYNMTLEPIAAVHVAVPPTMRHLNLAMVDIGAGTSDIAIVQNGTIVAYGMVPMAGDEITEQLCREWVLDFPTGERIKRELTSKESVSFTNVLGDRQTVTSDQIMNGLNTEVKRLAQAIAKPILEYNQGAPYAVLLIGGGSLTPHLSECLAEALGLPQQRVAARPAGQVVNLKLPKSLMGPEAVTPLGIGLIARDQRGLGSFTVSVGGKPVRLFHYQQGTVQDALLASGCNLRRLYGRPGLALTATVNGSLKVIRGEMGQPARVWLNAQEANLESRVGHGDRIEIDQPRDGRDATATLADLAAPPCYHLTTPNGDYELTAPVLVGGKPQPPTTVAADGSVITHPQTLTGRELLALARLASDQGQMTVDDRPVSLDQPIPPGSEVTWRKTSLPSTLTLNGRRYPYSQGKRMIVADLFDHIPMTERLAMGSLTITVNGAEAALETPVAAGDQVEIGWEKTV